MRNRMPRHRVGNRYAAERMIILFRDLWTTAAIPVLLTLTIHHL